MSMDTCNSLIYITCTFHCIFHWLRKRAGKSYQGVPNLVYWHKTKFLLQNSAIIHQQSDSKCFCVQIQNNIQTLSISPTQMFITYTYDYRKWCNNHVSDDMLIGRIRSDWWAFSGGVDAALYSFGQRWKPFRDLCELSQFLPWRENNGWEVEVVRDCCTQGFDHERWGMCYIPRRNSTWGQPSKAYSGSTLTMNYNIIPTAEGVFMTAYHTTHTPKNWHPIFSEFGMSTNPN